MFYIFPNAELRPRVVPELVDGEDTDVYRCSHLGHYSETGLPDYWKISRSGLATILRPYREDRVLSSNHQGHLVAAGRWFSKWILIRELTEFISHADAMIHNFPAATNVEFECSWGGLRERRLYDDSMGGFGGISETASRSARAQIASAKIASEWPHIVSELANRVLIVFEDSVNTEWVTSVAPKMRMDWIPSAP
jgi:hypothetical protein